MRKIFKAKILPPTYFLFIMLATGMAHLLFPIVKINRPVFNFIGIVLIALGIGVNIWADNLFKKQNTTVKPYERPSALQVAGPFKISRHPMYLGMAMILFGVSFILGSAIAFLFPVIFIYIINTAFIPVEEDNLTKVFKKEYLMYKKNVRRWI